MRLIVLFISFFVASSALAKFEGSLEVGSLYQSNPLYLDDNTESANATEFNADLNWDAEAKFFYFDWDVAGSNYTLSKYDNANRIDYDTKFAFGFGSLDRRSLGLYAQSIKETNPLDNVEGTLKPPGFTDTKAGLESELRLSKKSSLYISGESSTRKVDENTLNYLDRTSVFARLGYRYRFLPETFFFGEFIGGSGTFENGLENENNSDANIARRVKYDYTLSGVVFGVNGKLTKYTSIDATFGLKNIVYKDDNTFAEPVFSFMFKDQITPKDSLIAGYIYSVEDSEFSNWVLVQDMNIGYAKIMNDTFLFLLKMSYIYYSYSEPQRREDQRLLANLQIDYVFRPSWTLVTKMNMDILVSDAYDLDSSTSDRPASYDAKQFGLYIKRSF